MSVAAMAVILAPLKCKPVRLKKEEAKSPVNDSHARVADGFGRLAIPLSPGLFLQFFAALFKPLLTIGDGL